MEPPFDLFLVCPPGLEAALAEEAAEAGFADPRPRPGGVETRGDWPEVWRANITLRGAVRVLVRLGGFRAMHLAQLDKRARRIDWPAILRPGVPVVVEATCRKSRIYHKKAAAERVARAIGESLGPPAEGEDPIRLLVRIEDDYCSVSLDSTGAPLHQRGHKTFVGKAPLRESMAALFLRQMQFDPARPLVDPMCGSGTFVLEAAEMAAGLRPGRDRSFAFERLASADPDAIATLRRNGVEVTGEERFFGFDRDQGAVQGAAANAARAGVAALCHFRRGPVSGLVPPEGKPGLVMVNPPYGARIGNRRLLFGLYGALGAVLKARFGGWRVGLVTSDAGLAKATGLPWQPPGPPVAHGGLKVTLWRTGPLA